MVRKLRSSFSIIPRREKNKKLEPGVVELRRTGRRAGLNTTKCGFEI
jgi:hypothetical protein